MVVIAVGLGANKALTDVTPELKLDKYGDIVVEPLSMETSVKRVFAGGDIVGGEGTVLEAMGMAKKRKRRPNDTHYPRTQMYRGTRSHNYLRPGPDRPRPQGQARRLRRSLPGWPACQQMATGETYQRSSETDNRGEP